MRELKIFLILFLCNFAIMGDKVYGASSSASSPADAPIAAFAMTPFDAGLWRFLWLHQQGLANDPWQKHATDPQDLRAPLMTKAMTKSVALPQVTDQALMAHVGFPDTVINKRICRMLRYFVALDTFCDKHCQDVLFNVNSPAGGNDAILLEGAQSLCYLMFFQNFIQDQNPGQNPGNYPGSYGGSASSSPSRAEPLHTPWRLSNIPRIQGAAGAMNRPGEKRATNTYGMAVDATVDAKGIGKFLTDLRGRILFLEVLVSILRAYRQLFKSPLFTPSSFSEEFVEDMDVL